MFRLNPIERILFYAGVIIVIGIQWVPVSRDNPPVEKTIQWDSLRTKALFDRACLDCHSNETVWAWYSKIAPVSWMIAHHVNKGRRTFNISASHSKSSSNASSAVEVGKMPLRSYLLLHPKARLNQEERKALIQGLDETFTFGDN